MHLASAVAFFVILALTSLLLFTKTRADRAPTDQKLRRNVVYRVCGWVMLATLAVLGVLWLVLGDKGLENTKIEFIAETVLLEAFGISWLVKGGTILKDR